MKYSAKEVADKLKGEPFGEVTARVVNYYAFEKKMFDIEQGGKKCFTDKSIEQIMSIKYLQEKTSLTLDQIKDIINKYSYEDILQRYSSASDEAARLLVRNRPFYADFFEQAVLRESCATDSLAAETRSKTMKITDDISIVFTEKLSSEALGEIIKSINDIVRNATK